MSEELKKQIKDLKVQRDAAEMELAACQGERQRLTEEFKKLDERGRAATNKVNKLGFDLAKVELELQKANKEPKVSDHAVVRYLERKLKLNLDQIRAEILTPDLVDKMVRLGDGKYGFAVVKDRTVVTYLE